MTREHATWPIQAHDRYVQFRTFLAVTKCDHLRRWKHHFRCAAEKQAFVPRIVIKPDMSGFAFAARPRAGKCMAFEQPHGLEKPKLLRRGPKPFDYRSWKSPVRS